MKYSKKMVCMVLVAYIMTAVLFYVVGLAEQTVSSADSEYLWVLTKIESASPDNVSNDSSELIYSGAGGTSFYSYAQYKGKTDTWYDPPKIQGESHSGTATFSQPPTSFKPGEIITLNLELSMDSSNSSFFRGNYEARASFINTSHFYNEDGEYWFSVNPEKPSMSTTVSATAPGGSEGEQLILSIMGCQIKTSFTFEMQPGDTAKTIEIPQSEEPVIDEEEEEEEECEVCKDYHSKCQPKRDCGIRFNDISGEVLVFECRDLHYQENPEMAELNMVLNVNDSIKTGSDSYAVLSLADMTIFRQKANTHLILSNPPEDDNKLKLLYGKVMVNLKKMLKDGSMEVDMFQACAGIKGTVLICEETGSESILKVLEGTVEFTSKNTNESILVKAGEKVTATSNGLSKIESFDIEEELTAWEDTGIPQETIDKVMNQSNLNDSENSKNTDGDGPDNIVTYIFIGLGAALVCVVVLFVIISKMRK